MLWTGILDISKRAMDMKIITLGNTVVTVGTMILFTLIMLFTLLLSRWAQKGVARILTARGMVKDATVQIARRLTHYTVLIGGLVAALQTIGIDLSTLFAAGAFFAVGLGFAMQNITQNFVSGVILLVEQSIKPGDVIDVDGTIVRVQKMGIRSTVARTRNQEEIIIPNSILAQGMVKNYTLSDSNYFIAAEVGVVYSSDMKAVREVLEQITGAIPWRAPEHKPRIFLTGFGDSSVNFRVLVATEDPWKARQLSSDLHERIWWALKQADIVIAFPQLDVHFDPLINDSVGLIVADKNTRAES